MRSCATGEEEVEDVDAIRDVEVSRIVGICSVHANGCLPAQEEKIQDKNSVGDIDPGLVPKLVKKGFEGPIFATRASVDLLQFMLADSAYIQESNAERHNRSLERRGLPLIEPAYNSKDVAAALSRMAGMDYESWFEPKDGVRVRYWNAGHILGSASAEVVFDPDRSGNLDPASS